MKKIYTIKITRVTNTKIWYSKKLGREYQAELRAYNTTQSDPDQYVIGFKVAPLCWVHLADCEVIAEKLVPKRPI